MDPRDIKQHIVSLDLDGLEASLVVVRRRGDKESQARLLDAYDIALEEGAREFLEAYGANLNQNQTCESCRFGEYDLGGWEGCAKQFPPLKFWEMVDDLHMLVGGWEPLGRLLAPQCRYWEAWNVSKPPLPR